MTPCEISIPCHGVICTEFRGVSVVSFVCFRANGIPCGIKPDGCSAWNNNLVSRRQCRQSLLNENRHYLSPHLSVRLCVCVGTDLERKLKEAAGCRMRLIATDGVFSMDGNVAPLKWVAVVQLNYIVSLLTSPPPPHTHALLSISVLIVNSVHLLVLVIQWISVQSGESVIADWLRLQNRPPPVSPLQWKCGLERVLVFLRTFCTIFKAN